MTRKIFRSILLAAAVALLMSLATVMGMKKRGLVSAWIIFSSSWQAWPETWSISALS